jgi:hypothetical protein
MIPAIAEPLFQGFDTIVEIPPAMNLNDLKKAISGMQGISLDSVLGQYQ